MYKKIKESIPVFFILGSLGIFSLFSMERKVPDQEICVATPSIQNSYSFSSDSSSENGCASSETNLLIVASPGAFASNPCTENYHQKVLFYSYFREKIIGKFNSKIEQHIRDVINVTNVPCRDFFIYALRRIVI